MKEFKGTLGKWSFTLGTPIPNNGNCTSHRISCEAGEFIDVWVSDSHPVTCFDESVANAQLVASAPDMLKALELIFKNGDDYSGMVAKQAIDKALGEPLPQLTNNYVRISKPSRKIQRS